MKLFDFNRDSSAWRKRLRNLLRKHEAAYAFKTSKMYMQTVEETLKSLQLQEEQFAKFVIQKQKEIDSMEQGIIKSKMQDHLDKIALSTYDHFSKLIDKYQWMLKSDNDEEAKFNFSPN